MLAQQCEKLSDISEQLSTTNLDLKIFVQNEKLPWGRLIWTAIPALWAWLNHFPFLKIVQTIVDLFEDKTFHASLKYACGILILPLTYLIQILIISGIMGWSPWGWVYALSLPLSGLILLRNNRYWQQLRSKFRLNGIKNRKPDTWKTWVSSIQTLQDTGKKILNEPIK